MAEFDLDLRGVACPMNFVKTRLFLDKIQEGDLVRVLLDGGEPAAGFLVGHFSQAGGSDEGPVHGGICPER